METYYNTTMGLGFEGMLNYVNNLVNGWFANMFLFFIFIISSFVLSKSEWKMHSVIGFSAFLCLLLSLIMKLFMVVSEYVIFLEVIILGVCLFWGVINRD